MAWNRSGFDSPWVHKFDKTTYICILQGSCKMAGTPKFSHQVDEINRSFLVESRYEESTSHIAGGEGSDPWAH